MSEAQIAEGAPAAGALPKDFLGRLCLFLSCVALIVMIGVVAVDIFTRAVFNFSFEISEEVSGYMLVAFTFLALAVCQLNDSFHRVEFLNEMLSPKGRMISRLIFDFISLAFVALLIWQYFAFAKASYISGARAPTYLATPLWLPQSVMLLGSLTFMLAVLRSIRRRILTLKNWLPQEEA